MANHGSLRKASSQKLGVQYLKFGHRRNFDSNKFFCITHLATYYINLYVNIMLLHRLTKRDKLLSFVNIYMLFSNSDECAAAAARDISLFVCTYNLITQCCLVIFFVIASISSSTARYLVLFVRRGAIC